MTPGYGAPPGPLDTTTDERNMAMLAHLLGIFAGFLAPGIIYVIKRSESRFVAFHALQALLWHVVQMVVMTVTLVVCFGAMIGSFLRHGLPPGGPPPRGFFLGFFSLFVMVGLFGIINVVCAIYMGIQASAGRWSGYPVAGWLARRLGGTDDGV